MPSYRVCFISRLNWHSCLVCCKQSTLRYAVVDPGFSKRRGANPDVLLRWSICFGFCIMSIPTNMFLNSILSSLNSKFFTSTNYCHIHWNWTGLVHDQRFSYRECRLLVHAQFKPVYPVTSLHVAFVDNCLFIIIQWHQLCHRLLWFCWIEC